MRLSELSAELGECQLTEQWREAANTEAGEIYVR